ncbi:MAG: lactate utilization protein [Alphaproteobacteria bacterium]|nr:lactate utilization protein [Alphaproteobacteria bacterium]
MQSASAQFEANARRALGQAPLQAVLKKMELGFPAARRRAAADLPEFEALRDRAREIKDHVLAHLDVYLELWEERARRDGAVVHWCRTPEEARQAVLAICRSVEAKTVTKGKTMIGEEIGLNAFLERHGIEPIETDLGEYIIQLAGEPPSHIIAPAIHKTKDEVSDLFHARHRKYGKTERLTDPAAMVAEAREILRPRYQAADVGVTGANFLVAETGTSVIVTNEGNGDLTQTLPKVHVVLATLEKVIPTLEDLATLLRVLARSATGQEMSVYTTLSTGPRRAEDVDGPGQYHVVLLDNGRSALLSGQFREVLRCIRCGACMNHCPIYQSIGGHAYGWVYPGPIGAALTPALIGLAEARHLPAASTFCGRCEEVCPMRIPLPKLLRHWREQGFADDLPPLPERFGLGLWGFLARRPWLYRPATAVAARLLAWFGRKRGRFGWLPMAEGWTRHRDFPAPEGATFQELWRGRR